MGSHCSSTSRGDTDVSISSSSDIMNIRNEKGSKEECNLIFQPLEDKFNVLVANLTSVVLDCSSESFTIAGEEYCQRSQSFCVALSESLCNGTLSIPGCNLISADPSASSFKGHSDAQGHGLTIEYQFYNCRDLYTQSSSITFSHTNFVSQQHARYTSTLATEPEMNVGRNVNMNGPTPAPYEPQEPGTRSNLIGVLVPILLLSLILVLITCLYLFLKHKGKRRARRSHPEPVTFQRYISTVGEDNYAMANDMTSGSNLTLEFGRSYESVPRGTSQEMVPVYSVIAEGSNFSLSESIENRRYESIKPPRQDIRRLTKSSDTSSISNFSLSNLSISNSDVHSAVRNAPKPSTRNRAVMTQSLNDLTHHTDDSEQRNDATAEPYIFSNDVTDGNDQSQGRRVKSKIGGAYGFS